MAEVPPQSKRSQIREVFAGTFALGRAFWVTNFVFCLDGAAYFGVLNLLTLFLGQAVGMSDNAAGRSVSLFTGAVTISSTILGGVSDRLGARRGIVVAAIASLAGRALLAAAPSLPMPMVQAWVALALMGFSQGILIPACYAAVKETTTEANSSFAFSLLYAGQNGGALLEGLVSPFVRKAHGLGAPFWMCAGITAAYLVVQLAFFPRDKGNPAPRIARVVKPGRSKLFQHALFNPRFLYFIFILLGVRTLFAHQWLTMPDYITRAYPTAVSDKLEWIENINALIVLVVTPTVALITRKVHVVNMMIVGTVVSAGSSFLLVPGPNLAALIGYCVVFSIGESLWSSRFYEYVASSAPPDQVGVYMGLSQVPWFLAKFTTGFYSGAMLGIFCPAHGAQHTGTMWLIYALIGMTSPVGLFLARGWLMRGTLSER
jgi:proton-dependent oligopeptide transporter, POT family